jgi:peptidoglycan/xylan/chitin deacetylase (PgdA/CDA1 family)
LIRDKGRPDKDIAPMHDMRSCSCRTVLFAAFALCLLIPGIGSSEGKAVPVLIYHQVLPSPDESGETVISIERFKAQMDYLRGNGYTTITIADLVAFMKYGEAPERTVVLTFDDGWKSVKNAVPILKEHRFKASFWVIPGVVGYPHLDWKEILDIAKDPDFEIGAHSMTHPWDAESLATWAEGKTPGRSVEDAAYEVRESKRVLEESLDRKVPYFAWPKGKYNEALVGIAMDAGYEAMLTTQEGPNRMGDDVFRIRRIYIDGACDLETFAQTLQDFKYHVCQTKVKPAERTTTQ